MQGGRTLDQRQHGLLFQEATFVNYIGCAQIGAISGSIPGSNVMTFVGRLSVVTAYLAMAFVAAIVLGMI